MPLHLQHHKSYHPYNKDNVERVRRDEHEARIEEELKRRKAGEAEAEARLDLLRKRARIGDEGVSRSYDESVQDRPDTNRADAGPSAHNSARAGHVNFWDKEEGSSRHPSAGPSRQRSSRAGEPSRTANKGNADYEAEQKAERQRFEDRVTMYLGKPAKELQPWYGSEDLTSGQERKKTQEKRLEEAYKDSVAKTSSDPLLAMNAFLAQRDTALRQAELGKRRRGVDHDASEDQRAGYNDQYNRDEVQAAKSATRHDSSSRNEDSQQDFHERPIDIDPGPHTDRKSPIEVKSENIERPTKEEIVEIPIEASAIQETTRDLGIKAETAADTKDNCQDEMARPKATPLQKHDEDIGDASIDSMHSASTDSVESTTSMDSTDSKGRPRESMYPLLLGEMIETVLSEESYLFSAVEQRLLRSFFAFDYEARHLLARLIQRRSTWHRVDKLNYDFDVKDKEAAVANLCMPLKGGVSDDADDAALNRYCLSEEDMEGGDEEALNLMTLEELKILAKRMNKLKGATTKASIIGALLLTKTQGTLSTFARGDGMTQKDQAAVLRQQLGEMMGGCIRINPAAQALIDRVALVYYRGAEVGGSALTTAVLSRSRKRAYPLYSWRRSQNIYASRQQLFDMQRALALEIQMDHWIEWDGSPKAIKEALVAFEACYEEWKQAVEDGEMMLKDVSRAVELTTYNRMRFHPGWPLTRVIYKGVYILGRLHRHEQEAEVLRRLLSQRVFRRGRRGDWYDRLALITAQYPPSQEAHIVRKAKRDALAISVQGIEDSDTHLIYHDTLQRRITRLESQLRLPFSEKHDFSYAKLRQCQDRVFKGTRLDRMQGEVKGIFGVSVPLIDDRRSGKQYKPRGSNGTSSGDSSFESDAFAYKKPLRKVVKIEKQAGTLSRSVSPEKKSPVKKEPGEDDKDDVRDGRRGMTNDSSFSVERRDVRKDMHSVWRGLDGEPCRVESLVLQHYEQEGFKGFHCEGSAIMMLFALLMWDIVFMPLDGAFETPYQKQPLDLQEDSFSVARGPEIRQRLMEIEATGGLHLIRETDERERERKTWAVGCRWQMYTLEDILEIAECMGGHALSIVCQMLCEEFGHCTAGMPDLIVWRYADKRVRFCEVKGPGDKLSDKQKLWIDVLLRAGLHVEVSKVEEGQKA